MFNNIFPKSLLGLMRQHYLHHKFTPVMLPLVAAAQFLPQTHADGRGRDILSEAENELIARYRVEKRKNEWLTGRICAKMAALHYLREDQLAETALHPPDILIANTESGRPFLTGNLPQELKQSDLSLSHGGGYGLALIADTHCGIDVQNSRPTLNKVRAKFCIGEEELILQDALPDLPDLAILTLLWTAKEALKKALATSRMPGFLELILTKAEPHSTGWVLNFIISSLRYDNYPPAVGVVAELYDGYGIAACLLPKQTDA